MKVDLSEYVWICDGILTRSRERHTLAPFLPPPQHPLPVLIRNKLQYMVALSSGLSSPGSGDEATTWLW